MALDSRGSLNKSLWLNTTSLTEKMDLDILDRTLVNTEFEDTQQRWLQISILLVLAILGFVINIYVIIMLGRKRLKKTRFSNIDLLILHLGVADVLVAAFCVLADAIWKVTFQWLGGDFLCRSVKYMQMFSLYASTFIIVVISLDRCVAIVSPMALMDKQHMLVKLMVIFAWCLAAFCGLPQVFVFRLQKAPFPTEFGDFYQCVTHGAYSADWQETTYVVFTFCVIFALPLVCISICYALIFSTLHRESRASARFSVTSSQNSRSGLLRSTSDSSKTGKSRETNIQRAKTKSLWISALVIITFVICWAPYHMSMIYFVVMQKTIDHVDDYKMFQHIFFFGMSNSVLNPLVYGAFHVIRKSQMAYKERHGRTVRKLSRNPTIRSGVASV